MEPDDVIVGSPSIRTSHPTPIALERFSQRRARPIRGQFWDVSECFDGRSEASVCPKGIPRGTRMTADDQASLPAVESCTLRAKEGRFDG